MAIRRSILLVAAILITTLFLCVGYAAVSDQLSIGGSAEAPAPDTLIITSATPINSSNVDYSSTSVFLPTNVRTTISGSSGQKLVYRITVHNYSKTETFVFNGIEFEDLGGGISNKGTITVSSDANGNNQLPVTPNPVYVSGTPIAPGEEYVFYATYTLTDKVSSGEILVNYNFDTFVYSITYLDNNEVYAIDCIIDNSKVYNVRSDYPTYNNSNLHFSGWMNANAVVVTSYPAGNTHDFTLTSKWDNLYTIMFVDKDGNVLYQEQFTSSSTGLSAAGHAETNRILAELNDAASMDEMTVTWSDYTIKGANADIVVRPNYTYNGNLQYQPVDTNGDGIIDHYKVVAVGHLDGTVKVLGEFNDRPVLEVEKLYKNDNNFDYGSGVETIIIEEGVKILAHNSLSHTADLKTVYLPSTIEYLDKNVFSRNWGDDKKVITIYYNGTMAEWKALTSVSHKEWANGITEKDGTRVICTDGYFEFDRGFLGIGSKWNEYPN